MSSAKAQELKDVAGVDIGKLLASKAGADLMMMDTKPFGIEVATLESFGEKLSGGTKVHNAHDFGNLLIDSLPLDSHNKVENAANRKPHTLSETSLNRSASRVINAHITVRKIDPCPFLELSLVRVIYTGPGPFQCRCVIDDRMDNCLPLKLTYKSPASYVLTLQLIVPRFPTKEPVGRAIDISGYFVLVFEGTEKGPTILYRRMATLITGTKFIAHIEYPPAAVEPTGVASAQKTLPAQHQKAAQAQSQASTQAQALTKATTTQKLSSEAATFTSKMDKNYFDSNNFDVLNPSFDLILLESTFGISRASFLGTIVHRVNTNTLQYGLSCDPGDATLISSYKTSLAQHLKVGSIGNAFESIVKFRNGNETDSSVAAITTPNSESNKNTNIHVNKHFQILSSSLMLEEIQMQIDAYNYDYHCVDIQTPFNGTGELFHGEENSPSEDWATIEFIAPGSAESRPSVQVGNIVRLRPVKEHYFRSCQIFPGITGAAFEFRGVVVNYKLSTETVTVRIYKNNLRKQFIYVTQYEGWGNTTRNPLTDMKFHVRFELDRTAFFFAQEALSFIRKMAPRPPPQKTTAEAVAAAVAAAAQIESSTSAAASPSVFSQAAALRNMLVPSITPILKDWPCTPDYAFRGQGQGSACKVSSTGLIGNMNEEQSSAVLKICAMQKASVNLGQMLPPFCLYGPPGTGKTTTVIKAIECLVNQHETVSILASAPSDAAADVLCLKLHDLYDTSNYKTSGAGDVKIIRLNWWKRVQASVPIRIIKYCSIVESFSAEPIFGIPSKSDLNSRKVIVVSTCGAAGMLNRDKLFDYVFVDEASQAGEAESLIAASLVNSLGSLILAGDPKQLGPGCRSPANTYISSLLERLLNSPAYGNFRHPNQTEFEPTQAKVSIGVNPYKNRMVLGTYLMRNYRSHNDIIALSSELFYRSTLRQCGDLREINSIIGNWMLRKSFETQGVLGYKEPRDNEKINSMQKKVNKKCLKQSAAPSAALFVSTAGQKNCLHQHELGSTSFYNQSEIDEIQKIITLLLSSTEIQPPVGTADIHVICAFRKQTLNMRTHFRTCNLGNVDVGAVEDYQGQERRITIISTVLSSRPRMLSGISESYGLLSHARRFNVAVTRARALCIVVGNPNVLLGDPFWREYIEMCDSKRAFYGLDCKLLSRRQGEFKETMSMVHKGNEGERKNVDSAFLDFVMQSHSEALEAEMVLPPGLELDIPHMGDFRINTDIEWRNML